MAGSMPAVVPLVAGLCPTPSTSAASLPGPGSKADGSGGGADVVARVTLEVFAFEIIRAMELTTILNLCHHHRGFVRSEEHTSELQSLRHLVCRLLLANTI